MDRPPVGASGSFARFAMSATNPAQRFLNHFLQGSVPCLDRLSDAFLDFGLAITEIDQRRHSVLHKLGTIACERSLRHLRLKRCELISKLYNHPFRELFSYTRNGNQPELIFFFDSLR